VKFVAPANRRQWRRRAGWLALGALASVVLVRTLSPQQPPELAAVTPPPSAPSAAPPSLSSDGLDEHGLALPTGAPSRISCADAQRVTLFMARELAVPPLPPTPGELSALWAGSMDPHGLWSAAPDSPLQVALAQAAEAMLGELHDPSRGCAAAERVARAWQAWLAELSPLYDEAFENARSDPPASATALFELVAEPIFEDDPVTRPGRELSRELGRRLGAFAGRFAAESALTDAARTRFFPSEPRLLSEVVLLSALRSYVPLLDPHGDFAALEEEWALYAGDATLDAGSPLWADVTRTPLGARIVSDPAPPLQLDDLVLSINGFTLAGASVDQLEQAARTVGEHGHIDVRVLRRGEAELLSLAISDQPAPAGGGLQVERIPYGREQKVVLRVVISDVADDLAEQLEHALFSEAAGSGAVLLDLRGNGGGSLDAAVDALGLLLPGAPLFPLIHRGLLTEVLQAPRAGRVYAGPIAALVDGDTASAAEMLAGALQAYDRGLLVGARTFGKGCVQEYFDQVAASGVLRMTTLQFVMPDGRPLQQIGLSPDLALPLPPALERESHLMRQPITFDGPDVRDRRIPAGPSWPRDSAAAGPCTDPVVCRAISRLATAAALRSRVGKSRAGTR
jgi:carboxyl-terminal processing protease